MVAAIQRQLISGKIDEEEVHFYSRCLQHLSVAIGDDFELDPWTITSYELEFGAVVGSGMLSVYSSFFDIKYIDSSTADKSFEGVWKTTALL